MGVIEHNDPYRDARLHERGVHNHKPDFCGGDGMSIVLELPFPERELHPNARVHWLWKAREVSRYRKAAWAVGMEAKQNLGPLSLPVEAEVIFIVPDRRRRDEDGLLSSLKSAWDGLVDSGLLEDDRTSMLTVVRTLTRYEKGRRAVVVRLRSVTPAGGALSVPARRESDGR